MNDNKPFANQSNESENNGDGSMRSVYTAIVISILIAVTVFVCFSAK